MSQSPAIPLHLLIWPWSIPCPSRHNMPAHSFNPSCPCPPHPQMRLPLAWLTSGDCPPCPPRRVGRRHDKHLTRPPQSPAVPHHLQVQVRPVPHLLPQVNGYGIVILVHPLPLPDDILVCHPEEVNIKRPLDVNPALIVINKELQAKPQYWVTPTIILDLNIVITRYGAV